MSVDRLFDVRNSFYIGDFQRCINDAQKLNLRTDEEKTARDVYLYRSYVSQGKTSVVLSDIPAATTSEALKAVRRLAEFEGGKNQEAVLAQVDAESQGTSDDFALVIYGTILLSAGNPEDALRVLHHSESLEGRAASVHALLAMDRVDLAVKELKRMCEIDEDATITQLAAAWVNMSVGKEKLKDAFYIYQDMIDKYGDTPYLLVGQSNTLIAQAKQEEADKVLQLALTRDANSVEALVNRIVASESKARGANARRQLVQIRAANEQHPFVQEYDRAVEALNNLS